MIDYIKDIIDKEIKRSEILKHIPATVLQIVENTNNGKAVVSVMGRRLTLLNKSGEILKVGDGVIIHYWDNIANGYIALRCGLANPAGGLGIQNAVVISTSESDMSKVSENILSLTSKTKQKTTLDIAPSVFYVNGFSAYITKFIRTNMQTPSIINYENTADFAIGVKNELRGLDIGLFSQEVIVNSYYWQTNQYITEEQTYYTHISFSNNMQGAWAHRIGLYMHEDDTFGEQCDNVYFTDLSAFSNGGIIIVCNSVYPMSRSWCPYGCVQGYLAIRYDGGYIYDDGNYVSTDLIYANTSAKSFLFGSAEERDYAINLIQKDKVIPSEYTG